MTHVLLTGSVLLALCLGTALVDWLHRRRILRDVAARRRELRPRRTDEPPCLRTCDCNAGDHADCCPARRTDDEEA